MFELYIELKTCLLLKGLVSAAVSSSAEFRLNSCCHAKILYFMIDCNFLNTFL